MNDSLLTDKKKKEISELIKGKEYSSIISILEKIKTGHAGTAKTKDKRFVITEIVKHGLDSAPDKEKYYLRSGSFFCRQKEDVSKEIGVSLIWRGYKANPEKVKEYLLKTAADTNWEVREYAAAAFADTLFYNRDFYGDVMKLTKHHSENIRRAVVFSALGLRDKENLSLAFSILEPLLFDNSKYVKKNLGPFILGSYFGNKFPKETLAKLTIWSKIRDENVRWNVIMSFNNSFGNKYPAEALEILNYFAGDVDIAVKRTLKSTLNFLSKRHAKQVDDFKKKHKMLLK